MPRVRPNPQFAPTVPRPLPSDRHGQSGARGFLVKTALGHPRPYQRRADGIRSHAFVGCAFNSTARPLAYGPTVNNKHGPAKCGTAVQNAEPVQPVKESRCCKAQKAVCLASIPAGGPKERSGKVRRVRRTAGDGAATGYLRPPAVAARPRVRRAAGTVRSAACSDTTAVV